MLSEDDLNIATEKNSDLDRVGFFKDSFLRCPGKFGGSIVRRGQVCSHQLKHSKRDFSLISASRLTRGQQPALSCTAKCVCLWQGEQFCGKKCVFSDDRGSGALRKKNRIS